MQTMIMTGMDRMILHSPFIDCFWSFSRHRHLPDFYIQTFTGITSSKLFRKVIFRIGTAAMFNIG